MLVGAREPQHGPWGTPLVEPARALVAVGALSAAKAETAIDDYAFAEAMRTEHALEHRRSFSPSSRRPRRREVKPLEPRRVVPCDDVIETAQGTLHVLHVALTQHSTTIAVTWRPNSTGRRSRRLGPPVVFGTGARGPLQPTVVNDRGTRAGTGFSGGGSDQEWKGHLTTSQPLARDTAWIELDGTRVELTAEPADWEVSIETLPEQPPARGYLLRRVAIRDHFHEPESLDPAIDALVAAGALEADDPVIDEARALLGAMPHHPGMPSGRGPGKQIPQPWRSMLTRQGRHDGPDGRVALAAVTPPFEGWSVAVSSIESGPESFSIEVNVAPGIEGRGPYDWSVQPRHLAWWAVDDRGNHYLGQIQGWGGDDERSSGEIGFWPALHPKATTLRIMPTAESHRAVITVPLPWAEERPGGDASP